MKSGSARHISHRFLLCGGLCALLGMASVARGQSVTQLQAQQRQQNLDAGRYLREAYPQRLPTAPREYYKLPTAPASPQAAAVGDPNATLLVRRFQITGNEHISAEEIMDAVPFLRRPNESRLTLGQLDTLAAQVTTYYRSQGYFVASAFVLGQDVREGTVTITVLEGALDKSNASGEGAYAPEALKAYLDQALCGRKPTDCTGKPLERKRVDRAAGIVADLPGIRDVSVVLSPGSKLGTSDVTLQTTAKPGVEGHVGVDNHGGPSTGRNEIFGRIQFNNMTSGDRLALDYKTTRQRAATSYGVDYNFAMGYDGWRGGVSLGRSAYELGGEFEALGAHGTAHSITPYLSYPIIRSITTNLNLRGGYSMRRFNNYADASDYSRREKETSPSLGLDGNAIDAFGGGGVSAYSLTVSSGKIKNIDDNQNANYFTKAAYSLFRDQTLGYPDATTRLSAYGALRGQYSDYHNLHSYELFGLGGPDGVRAYPSGNAPGFRGYIGTVELRYSTAVEAFGTNSNLTLALFGDQGTTTRSTGGSDTDQRKRGGYGLSATLNQRDGYQIKAVWAARRGADKLETPIDPEEAKNHRMWLQGILFF